MPEALLTFLGFRIYFYSNEYSNQEMETLEPAHVHVARKSGGKEAKFWLMLDGSTQVADSGDLTSKEIYKISNYIEANHTKAFMVWVRHFGKGELKRI